MDIENFDNNCGQQSSVQSDSIFGAILAKHSANPVHMQPQINKTNFSTTPQKVSFFGSAATNNANATSKTAATAAAVAAAVTATSKFGFFGGSQPNVTSSTSTAPNTMFSPLSKSATRVIPASKAAATSRVTPQNISRNPSASSSSSSSSLTTNKTPFSNVSSIKPVGVSKSAPSSRAVSPRVKNTNNNSGSNKCVTPNNVSFGRKVGGSKGDTCVSARQAKMESTIGKIQQASTFKEQWAREKEQKLQRIKDQRDRELKRIQETSLSASESRRKNLEAHRAYEEHVAQEERNTLKVYLNDRIQASNAVEFQEKSRRRQSIAIRKEILTKSREASENSAKKQKDAERIYYEHKTSDFLSVREARYADDKKKRESLAFRGEEERRRKQVSESYNQLTKEQEIGYLEFRRKIWENERDYKLNEAKNRRQSIAGRLNIWRKQRSAEREKMELKQLEESSRFEVRHQDWSDIEQYKLKQCAKQRESLAGRLAKWRQDKAYDNWMQSEAEEAREIEQQLKDQAYEDMKAYERKQNELKRQSLAFRLEASKKAHKFDQDAANLRKMLEIEELQLSKLDHDDMDNYVRSLREAKRQSMHMRNIVAHEQKLKREGDEAEEKKAMHESFALEEAAWRDVKVYQEKMRAEARESLAFRMIEAKKGHEYDLNKHRCMLNALHDEMQSKRENWISMNEYKAQEDERRRMSIAYRLDSWKQEKLAKEMWRSKQQILLDEEARLRAQDWEDLQAAKRELELQQRSDFVKMAF